MNDVITDRELAVLLFGDKVKPWSWKTIQRMARSGKIQGQKVGHTWRFHRETVLRDLSRRKS